MSIEPLNTLSIIQYLQQVKQADASNSPEIRIPIDRAKALAYTLGMVMSRLEGDLEKYVKEALSSENEVININMDAGSRW
jgi:hypothetical protein